MGDRDSRPIAGVGRLLWAGLALLLPLPLLVFDGMVPLVRMILLATVTAAVAIREGTAGPVQMILIMFVAHAVVYGAALALLAWLASRALRRWSGPRLRRIVISAILVGAVLACLTTPYATPFAPAPRSNLLGVLS